MRGAAAHRPGGFRRYNSTIPRLLLVPLPTRLLARRSGSTAVHAFHGGPPPSASVPVGSCSWWSPPAACDDPSGFLMARDHRITRGSSCSWRFAGSPVWWGAWWVARSRIIETCNHEKLDGPAGRDRVDRGVGGAERCARHTRTDRGNEEKRETRHCAVVAAKATRTGRQRARRRRWVFWLKVPAALLHRPPCADGSGRRAGTPVPKGSFYRRAPCQWTHSC